MSRKFLRAVAITFAVAATAGAAFAGEAASEKYVWVPPVDLTQALHITMETKATEALLKRADEQCFDADCHEKLAACRKQLATCVIVPSKASVHEQEMENN